jgi:hypothetical protein
MQSIGFNEADEGTEPVHTVPKSLWILAAVLVVLAFVFRAVVPENLFLPGGWPLGSHWYHAGWVIFWVFLIAGLALVLTVAIKIMLHGHRIR